METPWGKSQTEDKIADGIIFYSTAGHGGIWLSPERLKQMPAALRLPSSFYNGGCWFEEDCEWARVALAFPEYFPGQGQLALDTMNAYHPAELDELMRERRAEAAKVAAAGNTNMKPDNYWHASEAAEEAMKDALYDQPQNFPDW